MTTTGRALRPTITVTMADGSQITGTHDHRVLVSLSNRKSVWMRLDSIPQSRAVYALRCVDVWDRPSTYDAGWLGGVLDGEGSVSVDGLAIGVAQNPGPVLDRLVALLPGWAVHYRQKDRVVNLRMRGPLRERMKFLGTTLPVRLVKKMYDNIDGFGLHTEAVRIVSVEESGVQEIVTLGTATETYVANGYCNHNTNFARLYGAGPAKIAATAGVSEAEIRHYLTQFDARFPGAAAFIKTVERTGKARASEEGEAYIRTLGGRRLPAPDDGIYRLLNYLVQGSCADIFKDAIVRLDRAGLADHIVVPVHDELLFEFPSGPDGEQAAKDACSLMETDDLSVPLTVGLEGPLTRWGDKYRD